ncbi:hypothetical protein SAMN02800694_1660 [Luteibacter sp. UNCMF331Sha3.1]|nr:hypothetical protein SAMN02800694_1660 [Luteibacter sp. UNCMF331Sha3.1]
MAMVLVASTLRQQAGSHRNGFTAGWLPSERLYRMPAADEPKAVIIRV